MIGVTRDGNVLTLEMQRPERRNALNGAAANFTLRNKTLARIDEALDRRALVAAVQLLAGAGAIHVAAARGDVNGDDIVDMVVSSSAGLQVFLGQANGGFAPASPSVLSPLIASTTTMGA